MVGEPNFAQILEDQGRRRPGDAEQVETPTTRFTVIYGRHDTPQQFPPLEPFDGIVLELVGDRRVDHTRDTGRVQYRPLVEEAKRLGKPLFFPDITSIPDVETQRALEVMLGTPLVLAFSVADRATRKAPTFTRRLALGVGLAVAAGGLATLARPAREAFSIAKGNAGVNDRVVLSFRNRVIAQKTNMIAETFRSSDRKPNLGIVMGASHSEIERQLTASTHDRLESIEAMLHDLAQIGGEHLTQALRRDIAAVTRLDWDAQKRCFVASIIEDPALVPLKSA